MLVCQKAFSGGDWNEWLLWFDICANGWKNENDVRVPTNIHVHKELLSSIHVSTVGTCSHSKVNCKIGMGWLYWDGSEPHSFLNEVHVCISTQNRMRFKPLPLVFY